MSNIMLEQFIAELKRTGVQVDDLTAGHLLAYVEQKIRSSMVREGRRTGQCEICGGEM